VLIASATQAKEPKHYQSGKLVKIQSVKCGTDAKDAKSLAGALLGTDAQYMKTRVFLCQEYMLSTSSVTYNSDRSNHLHSAEFKVGSRSLSS
jgi:hypothetical protein